MKSKLFRRVNKAIWQNKTSQPTFYQKHQVLYNKGEGHRFERRQKGRWARHNTRYQHGQELPDRNQIIRVESGAEASSNPKLDSSQQRLAARKLTIFPWQITASLIKVFYSQKVWKLVSHNILHQRRNFRLNSLDLQLQRVQLDLKMLQCTKTCLKQLKSVLILNSISMPGGSQKRIIWWLAWQII